MSKYSALIKRASNATAAVALTMASLTPAVMLGGSARAAQLTTRSIDMTSSTVNGASTYTVNFTGGGTFDKTRVDFCQSPLFDVACVIPDGLVLDAPGSQPYRYESTPGTTGFTIAVDSNPDLGTFYARISTMTSANATVNTGAVAMSTTEDVTINARVQERLTFCVGADTTANIGTEATGIQDCANWTSGDQIVNLGVVDDVSASPVPTGENPGSEQLGNNQTGAFILATNAYNGAKVYYLPASELMVPNATCIGGNASTDDQCFNNALVGDALATLTTGNEKFGMKISNIWYTGNSENGTISLGGSNDYDNFYIWDTAGDEIAAATKAVDWDKAQIDFAASVAAATPSGSYTTSANFVATGLF